MQSTLRETPMYSPFQSSIKTPFEPLGPDARLNQQKMILFRSSEEMKPCEKFGLDPERLQIQQLLKNRTYRRLYNIVANDQTSGDQVFRPNLIKELYFLLQITPFIQNSLKDSFLNKIEQWYNSNDHKKIKLSKNLDGIIKNVLHSKPKQEKQFKKSAVRPKSGVQWDTSLNPFLRPYTAKLRSAKNSQHKPNCRPESSKFGGSTQEQTHQEEANENEHNIDQNELQQICDIEEEWERSLDFKKKHRTLHPEQEPTYSKLMGLISSVKEEMDEREQKQNSISAVGYRSQEYWQNKRTIQSANLARQTQNARLLAEKELDFQNQLELAHDRENNQEFYDDGEKEEDQNDNQDETEQNQINLDQTHRKFTSDARSKQGRKIRNFGMGKMYANLNGVKILRPFTAKQSNIISKLNQYSSLQQNKKVMQCNLDQECLSKYKDYMKSKNTIKRQIFRRSQSKRYMDNFKSVVTVIPGKNALKEALLKEEDKENINQYLNRKKESSNALSVTQSPQPKGRVFDFSDGKPEELPKNEPKYNVKEFFDQTKRKNITVTSRGLMNQFCAPNPNAQKKMTYQKRLVSEQKFDPLHKTNLQTYNKEALEEIQKIKERFGGKITASTDNLIKALYVDAPLPFVPYNSTSPNLNFQVPDKNYLLIQKQEKKKKKRKLKTGSSKKSPSKSKR